MPDGATPLFQSEFSKSDADKEHHVSTRVTIDSGTLDVWTKKKVLSRISSDDLVWRFEVQDEDGAYSDMGCCVIRESGHRRQLSQQYNDYFAPSGLQATQYLVKKDIKEKYHYLIPQDQSADTTPIFPLNSVYEYNDYFN